MLLLAKAFWDIAFWKRTPAQLPASIFLLGLVAFAAAVLEVVGALLPPASTDRIVLRVVLSVGLPLLFAWAVLAVTHRLQRFAVGSFGNRLSGLEVRGQTVATALAAISRLLVTAER